jgi:hypothetical protein
MNRRNFGQKTAASYVAMWSRDNRGAKSGLVGMLASNNKLILALSPSTPMAKNWNLDLKTEKLPVFKQPHAICVDDNKNLFAAPWSVGNVYPLKLNRI